VTQAGFCSECNENVYLRADGGCANGHGPECVSGAYPVADPSPAPPAPAYAPAATVPAAPKKKRGGLVVVLVLVVLLLLGGCGVGGLLLFRGLSSSDDGTAPAATRDAKAEVAAAFAFIKGMGSGDIELFKTVMPAETVKTVPKETWDSLMADAASDPTTFGALSWSAGTATATFSSGDGSKGSLDFKTAGTNLIVVTLKPEASESEDATLTVVQEKGRWTVTAFETVDGVLKFDPESVKALGQ